MYLGVLLIFCFQEELEKNRRDHDGLNQVSADNERNLHVRLVCGKENIFIFVMTRNVHQTD